MDKHDSDEVLALKILSSEGARKDPRNHVIGKAFLHSPLRQLACWDGPADFRATETLDILETQLADGIRVHFIVQMDGGEPCFTFPFADERLWRKFVLDCFQVGWE